MSKIAEFVMEADAIEIIEWRKDRQEQLQKTWLAPELKQEQKQQRESDIKEFNLPF